MPITSRVRLPPVAGRAIGRQGAEPSIVYPVTHARRGEASHDRVAAGRPMTGGTGNPAPARLTVEDTGPIAAASGSCAQAGVRARARPDWLALLPAAVTAMVLSIGIAAPSYWRDEAATVAAVHRPLGSMLRMLGSVDAVHGLYYLIIWPIAQLCGTGEQTLRLPSLVAMAVAAGFVTATGRRLVSPAVGVTAGLIFAAAPTVTEYGQMARSYAPVTMVAAIASYALVRALETDTSRVRWAWYAVSLVVLGALNVFALLIIPAHAITMDLSYRGQQAAGLRRAAFRRWFLAAATGIGVNGPLILLSAGQRTQIDWLPAPKVSDVGNIADLLGPPWMTAAIGAVLLTAGAMAVWRRRRALSQDGRPGPGRPGGTGLEPPAASARCTVPVLCWPWLVVPPVLLLLESFLSPVYTQRYIIFCVPAAALIVAVALAELARLPGRGRLGLASSVAAFLLIATLGIGTQIQYRQPWGHVDDIREADLIIAATARPGDGVLYALPSFLPISAAYPDGLGRLPNIQVGEAAIPSGTLAGTTVGPDVLRQRISQLKRLWVIQVSGFTPDRRTLAGLHLRLAWTWQISDLWLQLYVRDLAPHTRRSGH
jgi:mannosyltransferase